MLYPRSVWEVSEKWLGPSHTEPVSLIGIIVLFVLGNKASNTVALIFIAPLYSEQWLADFRFIFGLALFITGYLIHVHADQILNSLRNSKNSGYEIPFGGLFRWISCPNYLGEILEWLGWAIAHHRWYKSTFKKYPHKRRALIPFLF